MIKKLFQWFFVLAIFCFGSSVFAGEISAADTMSISPVAFSCTGSNTITLSGTVDDELDRYGIVLCPNSNSRTEMCPNGQEIVLKGFGSLGSSGSSFNTSSTLKIQSCTNHTTGVNVTPGYYFVQLQYDAVTTPDQDRYSSADITIQGNTPLPSVSPPPVTTTPAPPPTASTINPWYKQSFGEWLIKVSDSNNPTEIFGERYTAAQVQWVIYGLVYMVLESLTDAETIACIMNNPDPAWITECSSLIISTFGSISDPYRNPPPTSSLPFSGSSLASTEYFRDAANRFSLATDANAQGFGFEAANPIINLWRASRNMAYVLMVIVIIAMAFMIMFRVKLTPQTVITVQSALPRIVFTLILITFSYAIGGLMIDLMYVIIGLFAALITADQTLSTETWSGAFHLLTDVSMTTHLFYYLGAFAISLVINMVATFSVFGLLMIPLVLIAMILFLFFFIWKGIKIVLMLIKAYVQIILRIAFAPFILLGGAVRMGGFGSWMKGLLANILIFPVAGIMLFVSFLFLVSSFPDALGGVVTDLLLPFNITNQVTAVNTTWDPPLTFGTQNSASKLLFLFTSFSILMLIPKAGDIIKSQMQGREFGYGTAIGAEAALFGRPIRWAGRTAGKAAGAGAKTGASIAGGAVGSQFRQVASNSRFGRYFGDRETT